LLLARIIVCTIKVLPIIGTVIFVKLRGGQLVKILSDTVCNLIAILPSALYVGHPKNMTGQTGQTGQLLPMWSS